MAESRRGCSRVPKEPQSIDESAQDRLRKEEKLKQTQEQTDLVRVLSLPEGRRVMFRVLEMCGCGVIDTDPLRVTEDSSADTHHTYAAIGEITLGNRLKLDMLTLAPLLFVKMMAEAADRASRQIQEERRGETPGDDKEEGDESVES